MRRFVSLLLLVAFVCPYVLKVGIVGYWLLYRPYVVQQHCINKDKPQLACNGKCYLAQKLHQTETPVPTESDGLPAGIERLLQSEWSLFTVPIVPLPSISSAAELLHHAQQAIPWQGGQYQVLLADQPCPPPEVIG